MSKLMKIVGVVALINIVARGLSFLREMVIAFQYGTTYASDAIIAAYTVPNFIYLVVGGAFTTAFISVYHSTKTNKLTYMQRMFTWIVGISITIVILLLLLATPIMSVMVNTARRESLALTTHLFYWMMPSTLFLILSTWLSGVLNIHDQFKSSSVGILLYNLSFLIFSLLLSFVVGPIGYGIGAFMGAVIMVIYLWNETRRETPFRFSFQWATRQSDTKRVLLIALPILFGGATMQFYFVIHRIVAAQLEEGTVAVVNYASKLTAFPQAIMMTAVTTVIYPLLSKKINERATVEVARLYRKGLLYLFVLLVPLTFLVSFAAEPIVRLLFGYGQFQEQSIAQTVPVVRYFSWSMFFLAANTFITRFYYANGNSIIPVLFSIVTVFGVNVSFMYWTIDALGASSIALGTVLSAAVNFVLLALYYEWKYNRRPFRM